MYEDSSTHGTPCATRLRFQCSLRGPVLFGKCELLCFEPPSFSDVLGDDNSCDDGSVLRSERSRAATSDHSTPVVECEVELLSRNGFAPEQRAIPGKFARVYWSAASSSAVGARARVILLQLQMMRPARNLNNSRDLGTGKMTRDRGDVRAPARNAQNLAHLVIEHRKGRRVSA